MRSVGIITGLFVILAGVAGPGGHAGEPGGFAARRPVFAGSCKDRCPWGVLGDIVHAAMAPYGYDVQVCYTCGGGPRETRIVAGAQRPEPLPPGTEGPVSPLPAGPVDFGVTTTNFLWWAYQGTNSFAHDGPRHNLRLIAVIQSPVYLIVALRRQPGVRSLADLKKLGRPLRILWDGQMLPNGPSADVLAYYGLGPSAGRADVMLNGLRPAERAGFDLAIYAGDRSNAPEYNVWYEVSQRADLVYIALPDELLTSLARKFDMRRVRLPAAYLRGVDQPIPTVAWIGNAIYGRSDMPDAFAYDLARALDEHQDLLMWAYQDYSYNVHDVWDNYGMPVHPGAARYYRERGYMK